MARKSAFLHAVLYLWKQTHTNPRHMAWHDYLGGNDSHNLASLCAVPAPSRDACQQEPACLTDDGLPRSVGGRRKQIASASAAVLLARIFHILG
jgi:hypothetical protein